MRALFRPFLVLLAIIFLIEAWLWTHLEPLVAWVVARIPLRALKLRIAAAIDRLSPPAALIVFAVPAVFLFPFKLLTFWLIAHKHLMLAGLVFTFAKFASVGVTAFIFEATRPKLLQMAWFRWLYDRVLRGIPRALRTGRSDQATHSQADGRLRARQGRPNHAVALAHPPKQIVVASRVKTDVSNAERGG